jgi:cell division septation protein DedD
MNKKDDKPNKKSDPFSSSAQIFEDIFKEATQTVEKPGGEKSGGEKPKQEPSKRASAPPSDPRKQTVHPPAQSKQTRTSPKSPPAATKPAKKAAQPWREEPKPRPPEKPAKKISPLKIVLLVVLLAVLAGALVNYLGVFDVSALSDLLGLGKKEPVPAAVKKQVPKAQAASEPASKKPGDSVALAKKEESKGKKEEPSASIQGKEVASRVETAKPTAPAQIPEQVVTKAPVPAQPVQVKEEKPAPLLQPPQEVPKKETAPIAAAQNPQAAAPVSQPSPPVPPQPSTKAVKPEPPEPIAQVKSSSTATPVPLESSDRYPYSVYLGSYQTHEMAKKAISTYKEEGSPAYWSKVKLGDKGVWYRVYAGYFKNEAEAQDFISRRQLKDAEVKMTRYAILVGVFPTRAEAEQKLSMMLELGFPAYVIPETQGKMRLYSGGFLTKEGADMALSELASKGVKASTVER